MNRSGGSKTIFVCPRRQADEVVIDPLTRPRVWELAGSGVGSAPSHHLLFLETWGKSEG